MSIYRRFDEPGYPSLISTNVADRRPLFGATPVARLFMDVLCEVRQETGFDLLAFVVMPDHVHLVLKPSSADRLGKTVQLIKGRFARRYNQRDGRAGAVWQSRYHERALRSERELFAAIEYVHENPVAAGLAAVASDFPWSSASGEYPTDMALYLSQAKA
jgi:putative transposase